jgi:hypothetical protein
VMIYFITLENTISINSYFFSMMVEKGRVSTFLV